MFCNQSPVTGRCVSRFAIFNQFMLWCIMLKIRTKRRADNGVRAAHRLAQIETSIRTLQNEDLLDFADIFRSQLQTPLAEIAYGEMAKRNIKV